MCICKNKTRHFFDRHNILTKALCIDEVWLKRYHSQSSFHQLLSWLSVRTTQETRGQTKCTWIRVVLLAARSLRNENVLIFERMEGVPPLSLFHPQSCINGGVVCVIKDWNDGLFVVQCHGDVAVMAAAKRILFSRILFKISWHISLSKKRATIRREYRRSSSTAVTLNPRLTSSFSLKEQIHQALVSFIPSLHTYTIADTLISCDSVIYLLISEWKIQRILNDFIAVLRCLQGCSDMPLYVNDYNVDPPSDLPQPILAYIVNRIRMWVGSVMLRILPFLKDTVWAGNEVIASHPLWRMSRIHPTLVGSAMHPRRVWIFPRRKWTN